MNRRQGDSHIDVCVQGTDVSQFVIVWAGFHYGEKSELAVLDSTMNAPHHTVQTIREFLENQDVKVMDRSSKSPDMNPEEHPWERIVVHIHDMNNPPATAAQLCVAVQQAWVALRPARLRTLVRVCCLECLLSSMRVVVTPTSKHPSTMPLTYLHNLEKFQCQLFLLRIIFIDTW